MYPSIPYTLGTPSLRSLALSFIVGNNLPIEGLNRDLKLCVKYLKKASGNYRLVSISKSLSPVNSLGLLPDTSLNWDDFAAPIYPSLVISFESDKWRIQENCGIIVPIDINNNHLIIDSSNKIITKLF